MRTRVRKGRKTHNYRKAWTATRDLVRINVMVARTLRTTHVIVYELIFVLSHVTRVGLGQRMDGSQCKHLCHSTSWLELLVTVAGKKGLSNGC